jgi:hypothetical protein
VTIGVDQHALRDRLSCLVRRSRSGRNAEGDRLPAERRGREDDGLSDARDRVAALGADIGTTTPAGFGAYIRSEQAKWGQAIKDSGARVD